MVRAAGCKLQGFVTLTFCHFVAMAMGFRNRQAVKTNVVLLGLLTLPDEDTVSSQRRHPSLNKTASHPTNNAESTSHRTYKLFYDSVLAPVCI